jgi:integral membrane protein
VNAQETILRRFRQVALAEGISFLLLLCVAMPLKYMAGIPEAVKVMGWLHGVLFMAYGAAAVPLFHKLKWPLERVYAVFLAAILPLGTFVLDSTIRRRWAL